VRFQGLYVRVQGLEFGLDLITVQESW